MRSRALIVLAFGVYLGAGCDKRTTETAVARDDVTQPDRAASNPTPSTARPASALVLLPELSDPAARKMLDYAASCTDTMKSLVPPKELDAALRDPKTVGVTFSRAVALPLHVMPGREATYTVSSLLVPEPGRLWADANKFSGCDPKHIDELRPSVKRLDVTL